MAKKESSKELDKGWIPVRRGERYCSPRCGCDCTLEQHQRAHRDGAALAKKMPGYTPRIWENGGWHHEIISKCRRIRISPIPLGCRTKGEKGIFHFTAFIGDAGKIGGRWVGVGVTPQEAVVAALEQMQESIGQFYDLLKSPKKCRK